MSSFSGRLIIAVRRRKFFQHPVFSAAQQELKKRLTSVRRKPQKDSKNPKKYMKTMFYNKIKSNEKILYSFRYVDMYVFYTKKTSINDEFDEKWNMIFSSKARC